MLVLVGENPAHFCNLSQQCLSKNPTSVHKNKIDRQTDGQTDRQTVFEPILIKFRFKTKKLLLLKLRPFLY